MFYLVSEKYGPNRCIMYREGTSTDSDRGSGLDNSYCNYLAVCRYIFQIKNFFSRGQKNIFEKLNYSIILDFFLYIIK